MRLTRIIHELLSVFPARDWKAGYGYLAQNAARISRDALVSGLSCERANRD
jgi:hypothetical protein